MKRISSRSKSLVRWASLALSLAFALSAAPGIAAAQIYPSPDDEDAFDRHSGGADSDLSSRQIAAILAREGYRLIGSPVYRGGNIVAIGVTGGGWSMRFVIDPEAGEIVTASPTEQTRPQYRGADRLAPWGPNQELEEAAPDERDPWIAPRVRREARSARLQPSPPHGRAPARSGRGVAALAPSHSHATRIAPAHRAAAPMKPAMDGGNQMNGPTRAATAPAPGREATEPARLQSTTSPLSTLNGPADSAKRTNAPDPQKAQTLPSQLHSPNVTNEAGTKSNIGE